MIEPGFVGLLQDLENLENALDGLRDGHALAPFEPFKEKFPQWKRLAEVKKLFITSAS